MRFFIASDIHGSSVFCAKMLECYRAERADKLILLGDLLYHGPRNDLPCGYDPKKVIELLSEVKNEVLCVRGNCDTEVDQMVLDFPILAEYAVIPEKKNLIFVTHGHKFNKDSMPPLKKGDVLLHGHTHIPTCEDIDGITYINPGSVSIPKAGSTHGYIILENGIFTRKDLDGNILFTFNINKA